jgi:hypothetical protein
LENVNMARAPSIIDSASVEPVNRAMAPPEEHPPFDASDIQVVAPDRMDAKAREEKFMNERVVVRIEEGTNANDPMYVELGHNGVNQFVKRGSDQVVKRKFLYAALMAKKVTMNCTFGKDGNGNEFNRLTPSVSNPFRCLLVEDPNPQGGSKWVQRVMAESAGARA